MKNFYEVKAIATGKKSSLKNSSGMKLWTVTKINRIFCMDNTETANRCLYQYPRQQTDASHII